ncbi:MAG TPA: hypothetical protein PLL36_11765, partial [Candidatus Hydrogenedentes bacterium]|nr:hypothetical protein [Candidatus Hydrogenedentota bacterium]
MRRFFLVMLIALMSGVALGQGIFSDVMSGKLISPEVGVFAWYELKDEATGQKLYMRQAIVGEKKVEGKQGYYLETEVMPEIGFPIIYKMLLTGPASDPANVHEIMVKDGAKRVEHIPVDVLKESENEGEEQKTLRESLGKETITTPAGAIETEHFTLTQGDSASEVWLNNDVRPMGIVRLTSPEGELLLTRFGTGGPDAESAIDRKLKEQEEDVKVEVTPGPSRN